VEKVGQHPWRIDGPHDDFESLFLEEQKGTKIRHIFKGGRRYTLGTKASERDERTSDKALNTERNDSNRPHHRKKERFTLLHQEELGKKKITRLHSTIL